MPLKFPMKTETDRQLFEAVVEIVGQNVAELVKNSEGAPPAHQVEFRICNALSGLCNREACVLVADTVLGFFNTVRASSAYELRDPRRATSTFLTYATGGFNPLVNITDSPSVPVSG